MLMLIGLTVSIELQAHEIRPALLNIIETKPGVFDITWKMPALGDQVLSIKPVLPSSLKPVSPSVSNMVPGAIIEYATYRLDGESLSGETIIIEGLSAVQIDVLVQIALIDGTTHSVILQPKNASYVIPADGSSTNVAWSYWRMGVFHILSGFDHLLFVLALMLLVPNKWKLFKTITAFTLAHSVTLALAALGLVNVPPAPTEAVIALSIVFLASEIIHSRQGKFSLTERYPWIVAMIFGLFHGLGFAGALTQVGLPANEIPLALLMFNIGVESGQVLFLLAVLAVLAVVKRSGIHWLDRPWKLLPYIIGSLAAFWTIERMISFL